MKMTIAFELDVQLLDDDGNPVELSKCAQEELDRAALKAFDELSKGLKKADECDDAKSE